MTENESIYFDLSRGDAKVFDVVVKEAGTFNITTTGRLHTALTLRDRFTTNLFHADANGIGRNALISAYLLPGGYQAVIETKGKSAGHAGVQLNKRELVAGGIITMGREKRFRVPAGEGIAYTIPVEHTGTYKITSYSQDGYFGTRLDDREGWPLVTPGTQGNFSVYLEPGDYTLISLPDKRTRVRVARCFEQKGEKEYEGFGPHTLTLNKPAVAIWNEDPHARQRKPVVFRFFAPASMEYTLSVTDRFTAGLIHADSNDTTVHTGTQKVFLPRGNYTILVTADSKQNLAEYQLHISTNTLVSGLSYTLRPKGKRRIPVAVGKHSVVEIYSEGMLDVDGTLTDSGGKVIAYNDDNTMDWNFTISRLLPEGFYTLAVSPRVTAQTRTTTVCMNALSDTLHDDWSSGRGLSLDLGGKMHSIPIRTGSNNVIYAFVNGRSKTGAFLERVGDTGHSMIQIEEGVDFSLSSPVRPNADYRLHVWSVDHINEHIELSVSLSRADSVMFNELKAGIAPSYTETEGTPANPVWFLVDMGDDSINTFALQSKKALSHAKISAGVDSGFTRVESSAVQSLRRTMWLECGFAHGPTKELRASDVYLSSKKTFSIGADPATLKVTADRTSVCIVTTEMRAGFPMTGILSTENAADLYPNEIPVQCGAVTAKKHSVVAVPPGETNTLVMWNADSTANDREPTVVVTGNAYKITETIPLSAGHTQWKALSNTSRAYTLNFRHHAQVEVGVPQNGYAVLQDNAGGKRVLCSGDNYTLHSLRAQKGTLYLIKGKHDGIFSVDCLLYDEDMTPAHDTLAGESFRISFAATGYGRKRIPLFNSWGAGTAVSINLSRSLAGITWWRRDGMRVRISSGRRIHLHKAGLNGFFSLSYTPGDHTVLACTAGVDRCLWGGEIRSRGDMKITGSRIITLKKPVTWVSIRPATPLQLTIKSNDISACVVARGQKVVCTMNNPYGITGTVPLETNEYTVGFRRSHSGNGTVAVSLGAIQEMEEGVDVPLQLASGGTRYMKFQLVRDSRIGIGIESKHEVFDVAVLDENLNTTASGKQVFSKLKKGTYYVSVSIPDHQKAAACVIRLFGRKPPPDTPPAAVQRKYLELHSE
ncbi:MAG: hypothetical protein GF344_05925 [Chitinivibrionales bacterium]|nr:hypothetical protein [Chitinivibrionales bacterium]MBD3356486.1 hypothetical protein [Chitinivibrionales bacterium]